jgi:surface protein
MSFNQNIGNWDTSSVTNMAGMFQNSDAFNNGGSSDINNWDTALVQNMSSVFYSAVSFNQPIDNWNVSSVTNMQTMFYFAIVFNQPLSNWERTTPDVSTLGNVTNMAGMFNSAIAFNQNIGNWDISNVAAFDNPGTSEGFMWGKSTANFSTANLAAIYVGWSSLPSVVSGVDIDFYQIKYTNSPAVIAARSVLTSAPNNWNITDAGPL